MNALPFDREGQFDAIKQYVATQATYLKLEAVEKLSRIFSSLILIFVCLIFALCGLFYLSIAFILWSEPIFQSTLPGTLIVALFFILLIGLLYLFRVRWLLNPLIRMFSKILFDARTRPEEEKGAEL